MAVPTTKAGVIAALTDLMNWKASGVYVNGVQKPGSPVAWKDFYEATLDIMEGMINVSTLGLDPYGVFLVAEINKARAYECNGAYVDGTPVKQFISEKNRDLFHVDTWNPAFPDLYTTPYWSLLIETTWHVAPGMWSTLWGQFDAIDESRRSRTWIDGQAERNQWRVAYLRNGTTTTGLNSLSDGIAGIHNPKMTRMQLLQLLSTSAAALP